MKHTILFLLIPIFAFAQKSEQVKNYLGESKYMEAPVSGKVNFVFQKGTLSRESDGKKSFAELLKDGVGYSDADNAGKLKGITENGVLIRPYVRTQSAVVPESARGFDFAGPDSAATVDYLENAKVESLRWNTAFWKVAKPGWEFAIWFMERILFPFILIAIAALRYIAKTGAGDSAVTLRGAPIFGHMMYYAHQFSAGALMAISWFVVVMMIVHAILRMVWAGFDPWFIVVVTAVILFFAEKITNWIVPNPKIIKTAFDSQPGQFKLPG
jgi:hypothetical protein